jgi:hypothetical protein
LKPLADERGEDFPDCFPLKFRQIAGGFEDVVVDSESGAHAVPP